MEIKEVGSGSIHPSSVVKMLDDNDNPVEPPFLINGMDVKGKDIHLYGIPMVDGPPMSAIRFCPNERLFVVSELPSTEIPKYQPGANFILD